MCQFFFRNKNEISKEQEKPKEQIPTSTERYIEVSTNLKEILKSASASPFTLTSKFSSDNNQAREKIADGESSILIIMVSFF